MLRAALVLLCALEIDEGMERLEKYDGSGIANMSRAWLACCDLYDHPFADAQSSRAGKVKTFASLESELGINGNIMYVGDAENDNPAFELCDIKIGVIHEQTRPVLKCPYLGRLDGFKFLQKLLESVFDFPSYDELTASLRI
ncbi:MAG: hypothetical protein QXU32_10510 [Nitrososphaerales archaeon]